MAVSAKVNNLNDLNNDGPISIMQRMMQVKDGSFDEYLEN